jgi:hypothetical protein
VIDPRERAGALDVTDVADVAPDGGDAAAIDDRIEPHTARSTRSRSAWSVAALTAVVGGIPLVVALLSVHAPRWYPVLDYALIELRVRDVPTHDVPLVGLAGRLEGYGLPGSHPGPLGFWVLWPIYKVLGGSAWALQAATAVLNTVAIGLALWIAQRRGGRAALLGLGVALALLLQGYGIDRLTVPWNPWLPMLWWVVFLLAAWSVLCDDLALLPLAVFSGSLCAQTHVPYLGSVAGVLAFVAAVMVLRAWRTAGAARRRLAGWGVLSAATLAALWLAPVVDELRHSPGNLSIIRESFSHPPEPPLGLGRRAFEAWLSYLDVRQLPQHGQTFDVPPVGSPVAGAMLLGLWAGALVIAWRRRHSASPLWRLHLVVAAALVLGLVSITRIHGEVWAYLLLWAWGTTALVVVATVWSAAVGWSAASAERRPPRWGSAVGAGVLVVALLGSTARLTSTAAHAEAPDPAESRLLAQIVPDTIGALNEGRAPGGGPEGRYLVMWSDALAVGSAGFGLLLELERAGFDVGASDVHGPAVVRHRVRDPADATAIVLFVRGVTAVDRMRQVPGVVEVSYNDPRTREQIARYDELRSEVVAGLRSVGLDDLVERLDQSVLATALDERFPAELRVLTAEMIELGQPSAVLVGPPDASWPMLTSS